LAGSRGEYWQKRKLTEERAVRSVTKNGSLKFFFGFPLHLGGFMGVCSFKHNGANFPQKTQKPQRL
jgi:hypothetical protein